MKPLDALSLPIPSSFLSLTCIIVSSARGGFQEQKPTTRSLQTSIPTEKDLILAHNGKLNEDGTNMTICPRH